MGKPFDVVIDLTQFSTDNEVPNQWLTQLLQIVPPEVTESVANIYFYNANSGTRSDNVFLFFFLEIHFLYFLCSLQKVHQAPVSVHLRKDTEKDDFHLDPVRIFRVHQRGGAAAAKVDPGD